MYFPYLRGRQFELIALRELVTVLSPHIIPIIEPVKLSSTLISTIKCFEKAKKRIALVVNPQVGDFHLALENEKNGSLKDKFSEIALSCTVIKAHILNQYSAQELNALMQNGANPEELITICKNKDYIPIYEEIFASTKPQYNLISDDRSLKRRIKDNQVLLADRFSKVDRNSDYAKKTDEAFSEDHLYYEKEGYLGFSDYSVIGDDYVEAGFAPYAVAIHIVYFDDEKSLRVRHFVSDTNDDISDPAGKFAEAVRKLVRWNIDRNLDTMGIRELINLCNNESYPGLGTVKKLSIMHHLELMSRYLTGAVSK